MPEYVQPGPGQGELAAPGLLTGNREVGGGSHIEQEAGRYSRYKRLGGGSWIKDCSGSKTYLLGIGPRVWRDGTPYQP